MTEKKTVFMPLFGRSDMRFAPALAATMGERGYRLIIITEIAFRAFALKHYDRLDVAHFNTHRSAPTERSLGVAESASPYLAWAGRISNDPLRFYVNQFRCWMRELFELYSPALVMLWNGDLNLNQVLTRELAEEFRVPVCYMEMGFFRKGPNSIQIDMGGVNANSLWFRDWRPYAPLSDDEAMEIEEFLGGYVKRCLGPDPLPNKVSERVTFDSILFPLQVHDDTQLFQLAGEWGNLAETLSRLIEALPGNIRLVVKAHPEKRGTVGIEAAREKLRPQDVFLEGRINIHRLIERCRAVVTINSTVGLEALVHDRPVLVLGNAAYAKDGLTMRYSHGDSLTGLLADLQDFKPDHNTRLTFFRDLKRRLFTYEGNIVMGVMSDADYSAWAGKILEIAGLPSAVTSATSKIVKPADRLARALREFSLNKDYLRLELRGLLETLGAGPIHLIGARDTGVLAAFLLAEMGIEGELFDNDERLHGRIIGGRKVRPLENYRCPALKESIVICSSREPERLHDLKRELRDKHGFAAVYTLADLFR